MYTEDGALLNRMLDQAVCEGPMRLASGIAQELHDLCAQTGDTLDHPAHGQAAARITGLDARTKFDILRLVTARFHLLNKAEQLSIAEINRSREATATPEKPRPESLEDAVRKLAPLGKSASDLPGILSGMRIEPTLTAHPTEARRRTILDKQLEVARCVRELRRTDLLPREREELEDRLWRVITVLLVTDDVRARRLEVPEEVRNGLYYLRTSIWETVPRLMRDLVRAANGGHPTAGDPGPLTLADLPGILTYRSWIGGDRDGNPNVTAAVTRHTLETLRSTARTLWLEELEHLRRQLSVSSRRAEAPAELLDAIARSDAHLPGGWIAPSTGELLKFEPFRYRIRQMMALMETDESYDASRLLEDLMLLRRSLHAIGLHETAEHGMLADAIVRARAFGFHLAALDIRQHSRVHEAAVAALLAAGGVTDRYAEMDEDDRLAVLEKELASPRPLRPRGCVFSGPTSELLSVLEVVRESVTREPESIRAYVISMTDSVSDMLEVLLLMKEAGIYRPGAGDRPAESLVEIVPLFETIDDLQRGPDLTARFLDHPAYRGHLDAIARARGESPKQEIMLGYSDSNKDGGFFMANAALHRAQDEIGRVVRERDIRLCFFHGRGGTVGRGGGRAGRAIQATPPNARTGLIRFTEQGEVISFRYALPEIARRHLEQIVHSTLLVSAAGDDGAGEPSLGPIYARMAARSMEAYRGLIDAPAFWGWFVDAAPIATIAGLPIASRPVSRTHAKGSGGGMTFDSLRAIPWVFSWIQMRILAPGWFGLGTALAELDDSERAALRERFEAGGFLATVFENAMQELARVRLPIAKRYAMAAEGGETIWPLIEAEYERTRSALLAITGWDSLLAHARAIERAIEHRNPWTDVLNLIQIDLLTRAREAGEDEREALTPMLQASVNGIAAGMQSTG